jgi:hypothetical protein
MSETSTTPSPQTQLFSDAAMKKVAIENSCRAEPTSLPTVETPRFPVRVRNSEQPVLLRLDTKLLAEQRKITEANESILRRSQS